MISVKCTISQQLHCSINWVLKWTIESDLSMSHSYSLMTPAPSPLLWSKGRIEKIALHTAKLTKTKQVILFLCEINFPLLADIYQNPSPSNFCRCWSSALHAQKYCSRSLPQMARIQTHPPPSECVLMLISDILATDYCSLKVKSYIHLWYVVLHIHYFESCSHALQYLLHGII